MGLAVASADQIASRPTLPPPRYCTKALTSLKFTVVGDLMADEALGKSSSGLSFFFLAAFNLFYVMVANTMVYLEPVSAGSGEDGSWCRRA